MTNNTGETQPNLFRAIRNSAIGLAIFAFFTAGIISVTQQVTVDQIELNEKEFEARLLLSLLPEGYNADNLLDTATPFSSLNINPQSQLNVPASEVYYRAVLPNGELGAVLLPLIAPDGYTEAIRLVVGISPAGEVLGVRVTKHKETPGLGDQIELAKSDWILSFNNKSLTNPPPSAWAVKKDGGEFDQMTGATITPRAIVTAVKRSLDFYERNKKQLNQPPALETEPNS